MSLVDRADFPAAAKVTYLNAASVALMPRPADAATAAWHRDIAENGTLNFDEVAEERVFDDLRSGFAALIGARPTEIAVGSSATEMISSVAWALMPASGKRIVTTDVVFPTTAYPWARVARHSGAAVHFVHACDGVIDEDELVAAIDHRTAVVTICHVEYATGQRYALERLAEACKKVGAFLLVDASQSVGAVPLEIDAMPVDAIVTTSYKWLCGPFGVGLLYLSPEWQARLDPGIVGWRTHAEVYDLRADRCVPHDDTRRFESSTMAYGAAVGLGRSIGYLRDAGLDRIAAHVMALADRLIGGLSALGASIISPLDPAARSPIVSARFPGREPRDVVGHLGREGVVVSARRDGVRFSPHLYNTEADIDRALEVLRRLP